MPVEVEGEGLMAAMQELAESAQKMHEVACVFDCRHKVLVEDAFTATHLYHIAKEAVHNALKHANARHVWIQLSDGGGVNLTVRDDGRGLGQPAAEITGQGFRIMRYRAGVIGATLTIDDAPGGGVIISCTLPQKQVG